MLCSFSNLDDNKLKAIQELEGKLGKTLVSFSCHDVKPSALEAADLEQIQALEKELSVSLVAVEA